MEFAEFILAHDADDLGRLALARERYAGQVDDFDLALTSLEVRRKLRDKVPQWWAVPSLRYPFRLSGEQCSSAETARYKASVALSALSVLGLTAAYDSAGGSDYANNAKNALCEPPKWPALRENGPNRVMRATIADLTGGLGVDSWAFSQVFDRVLYNEMRPELAAAARHNFRELGLDNILVKSCTLGPGTKAGTWHGEGVPSSALSVAGVLGDFRPDIIFLDPARRSSDGRKVFLLEDCQPDVLQLLPELLAACPRVLLKLSPMADISLACTQLGCVKQVHVVAADGECKELLLLLERGWNSPWSLTVYESGAVAELGLAPQCAGLSGPGLQMKATPGPHDLPQIPLEGIIDGLGPSPKKRPGPKQEETWSKGGGAMSQQFLFEPGKALLKSGAFDWPCRFGLSKLGRHTHLYVSDALVEDLAPFGKWYRILEVVPLNNKSIKDISARYPGADVTARNIPLGSEQLRAKLAGKPQPGAIAAGTVHIFGIHVDALNDNFLLVTTRVA